MKFLLALLITFSWTAHAGLVLGVYGGGASDRGSGIEKIKGSVVGGKIGYRWNWLALELARTSYNLSAKKGQADDYYIQKASVKGSVTDIGVRFYPFSFLSLTAGISSVDLDSDIQLTNVNGDPSQSISEDGSSYDSGSYWGAGLHLPIGKGFEIYGEYLQRTLKSSADGLMGIKVPNIALNEWHAGLTWTWESRNSRKRK
jgi:hypothetical protein